MIGEREVIGKSGGCQKLLERSGAKGQQSISAAVCKRTQCEVFLVYEASVKLHSASACLGNGFAGSHLTLLEEDITPEDLLNPPKQILLDKLLCCRCD